MKRVALAGAAVALIVAVVVVVRTRSSNSDDPPRGDAMTASQSVDRFFAEYVRPDGRVSRVDQGDDTVSEGQAYAMLLALAAGDQERFDTVWKWTAEHLQRGDHLFSWRWQNGQVIDTNSAADADLDIASALNVAARQFRNDRYAEDARNIASAVLDHESVQTGEQIVIVAGPWAVSERVVNPSYLARCDYDELALVTDDARWKKVRDTSFQLLRQTVGSGLPPDWARLDDTGALRAIASPTDRQGTARYGLDAVRVPARLAECRGGQDLTAAMWQRLRNLDGDGAALAYSLDGARLDGGSHPAGMVATALAAHAAGDGDEARRRMTAAAGLERQHPSYYGAAWVALGEQLLSDHVRAARVLGTAAALGPAEVRPAAWIPQQVPPTTATLVPAQTTSTTTSTTSTTTTPPSTTTTTTGVPSTTTTGRPSTTTTGRTTSTTTSTTTTRPGTTTSRAATTTSVPTSGGSPTDEPGASGGTPSRPPGDLTSRRGGIDQLQQPNAATEPDPQEQSRRRTAAVVIGGGAAVLALAGSLGLRERSLVRRRLEAGGDAT